jgi:UDP-2,3-diacylglucosamine diphosphatase
VNGASGDLVFVGDVHLDHDDPAVGEFVAFLRAIADATSRLVLAGDLFEWWIGRTEMERPHHKQVIAVLRELRARGVVVRYLEGNRDFNIGAAYAGIALDDASAADVVERFGGWSIAATHGDRVNQSDRLYKLWRAIARSKATWLAFNALPATVRIRIADGLRSGLEGTNRAYKSEFPESWVRRFAAERFRSGHDLVVLGHFHVEKDLRAVPPSPPGRILVLPEWKGSRRHLRVSAYGSVRFETSPSSSA